MRETSGGGKDERVVERKSLKTERPVIDEKERRSGNEEEARYLAADWRRKSREGGCEGGKSFLGL